MYNCTITIRDEVVQCTMTISLFAVGVLLKTSRNVSINVDNPLHDIITYIAGTLLTTRMYEN